MFSMTVFYSIILPCLLMGGVLLLRPLRRWLEGAAQRAVARTAMVEEYHAKSMLFLKSTDPVEHAKFRETIVTAGHMMMDGTKLIRGILFVTAAVRSGGGNEPRSDALKLSALPDDAQRAFSQALGAALITSTYQSFLFGSAYRSVLMLALIGNDSEIAEPEQIVYRFGRSKGLRWRGRKESSTC